MTTTDFERPADGGADPFFDRYGDALDDRIGEVVEEMLANRVSRPTLHPLIPLIAVLVLAAAGVSVLMQQNPVVVGVVWGATAVICGCLTRLVLT
jgi:hypothetical protein